MIEKKSTWELKNMYKALNTLNLLNTEEENKRLEEVKKELIKRKK
jgi:hypothetical protein